jgi:hypothetical protein
MPTHVAPHPSKFQMEKMERWTCGNEPALSLTSSFTNLNRHEMSWKWKSEKVKGKQTGQRPRLIHQRTCCNLNGNMLMCAFHPLVSLAQIDQDEHMTITHPIL